MEASSVSSFNNVTTLYLYPSTLEIFPCS